MQLLMKLLMWQKKVKVFPGFVNALLKNILNNFDEISKIEIDLCDFPDWFTKQTNDKKNFNLINLLRLFVITQVYIWFLNQKNI